MKDIVEAGHHARWDGDHYVVSGPAGIEIGRVEEVGDAWVWVEFVTEYDHSEELAPRMYERPEDALHAMLEFGGWLV